MVETNNDDNIVLYQRIKITDEEDEEKDVAVVTLNRPNYLNCFNADVCQRLCAIFSDLAQESLNDNSNLVAVIFTGNGKAFCAGADLSNPPNPLIQSSDLFGDLRKNPTYFMEQVQVPIIGAVQGYCVTGGFELALACDILVGDLTTKFKDTHVKFGFAPCWGLSQKLQRRIGPGRAKWVSFSAATVTAEKALEWGLLNEIAPEGKVVDYAMQMARTISKNNKVMVRRYKRAIEEGGAMDLKHGLQRERELGIAHYLNTFENARGNADKFINNGNRPRSKL